METTIAIQLNHVKPSNTIVLKPSKGDRLGAEIRRLRAGLAITASELARRLKKPPATISQWERGESFPSGENLVDLAKALGVRTTRLLVAAGIEEPDPDETAAAPLLLPPPPEWFFSLYRDMGKLRGIKPVDQRECVELAVRIARIRQSKPLGPLAYQIIMGAVASAERLIRGEDPPSPTAASLPPGTDPPGPGPVTPEQAHSPSKKRRDATG